MSAVGQKNVLGELEDKFLRNEFNLDFGVDGKEAEEEKVQENMREDQNKENTEPQKRRTKRKKEEKVEVPGKKRKANSDSEYYFCTYV